VTLLEAAKEVAIGGTLSYVDAIRALRAAIEAVEKRQAECDHGWTRRGDGTVVRYDGRFCKDCGKDFTGASQ
jgi:hypothetical protein